MCWVCIIKCWVYLCIIFVLLEVGLVQDILLLKPWMKYLPTAPTALLFGPRDHPLKKKETVHFSVCISRTTTTFQLVRQWMKLFIQFKWQGCRVIMQSNLCSLEMVMNHQNGGLSQFMFHQCWWTTNFGLGSRRTTNQFVGLSGLLF